MTTDPHAVHTSGPSVDEAKAAAHAGHRVGADPTATETPAFDPTKSNPSDKVAQMKTANKADKCAKLADVLQKLHDSLAGADGDHKNPAVCALGDDLRACCGGNDNETAIKSLDKCPQTPNAVKGSVIQILNKLADQWYSPTAGNKYQIMSLCEWCVKELNKVDA